MIKLIKILAGPRGCYDIGSRVNLPADVEAEIVAAGAAEYIGSPAVVEVAASPAQATAQATVQKMPVETRQSPAKAKK
jgi:streptogramin lyase